MCACDGEISLCLNVLCLVPPSPLAWQGDEEALGRAESGFVGLDNQGATCYLNALLQVLVLDSVACCCEPVHLVSTVQRSIKDSLLRLFCCRMYRFIQQCEQISKQKC